MLIFWRVTKIDLTQNDKDGFCTKTKSERGLVYTPFDPTNEDFLKGLQRSNYLIEDLKVTELNFLRQGDNVYIRTGIAKMPLYELTFDSVDQEDYSFLDKIK